MEAKEKIRAAVNLVDIISEAVILKPESKNRYKGLCPFHNEKTPSFYVMPDKGFYYCFGCHKKGDAFSFLMETQGLEFPEALKVLGDKTGIEVPVYQSNNSEQKRNLFKVNEVALDYFTTSMDNSPALEYLLGRSLTQGSIDKFQLGYAPNKWDGLIKYAESQGVTRDDLTKAGLVSESNGKTYDRFRNRVMFPISNYLGKVVGFTGRVLSDSNNPKYLNTPETEVFDKSSILYGLDKVRNHIRDSKECILVEGNVDVIILQQEGFLNTAAVLGSSLTEKQAMQLTRLEVESLYLAFDADEAGQKAILSGLDKEIGRQFLVKAVTIPHGKDPADAVLSLGAKTFSDALKNGVSEVEFRFNRAIDKYDINTNDGKKGLLLELAPTLKPRDLFDPVSTEMKRLVVDRLNLDTDRLDRWLKKQRVNNLSKSEVDSMTKDETVIPKIRHLEVEFISLLLSDYERLESRVEEFRHHAPNDSKYLEHFFDVCIFSDFNERVILDSFKDTPEGSLLFEGLLNHNHETDSDYAIRDTEAQLNKILSRLRELYLDMNGGVKEDQRQRLRGLMKRLGDDSLTQEELNVYRKEVRDIQNYLQARDAERRNRASY